MNMTYRKGPNTVIYLDDLTPKTIGHIGPNLRAEGLNHHFVFLPTSEEGDEKYFAFRELSVEIHEAGGAVVMADTSHALQEVLTCDWAGQPHPSLQGRGRGHP